MRWYFFFLAFLPFIIHCNKDHAGASENNFSFQYNGQTYNGSDNGWPILENDYRFRGIAIRNDSVLPGIIFFHISPSGCAYLIPKGFDPIPTADCRFVPADPADSAKVYLYRSGSINYSFSNCRNKTGFDQAYGRIDYEECTVKGTFSLTLANNNNEVISLSNGSFVFRPVRK